MQQKKYILSSEKIFHLQYFCIYPSQVAMQYAQEVKETISSVHRRMNGRLGSDVNKDIKLDT